MPHDMSPIDCASTDLLRRPWPALTQSQPSLAVVGLGYVGAVSAACFAAMGYRVIGVDLDAEKAGAIREGRAPLLERGLGELIARSVEAGTLTGCTDLAEAIDAADVTMISVGTPSLACGRSDLSALQAVARSVGRELGRKGAAYHLVVVRSTVPATTTAKVVLPILEAASGLRCGKDFGLCFQPEFLREGVAIDDFFDPPKTVIGAYDERSADTLAALYGQLSAPLIRTSLEVAEMVKQVDNAWHALKVAFANEVGRLCQALDADSHEIMGIFVQDTKLNISSQYLKPGFAFGGSCLPKDVRSLCAIAGSNGIDVPLMRGILASNDAQILHALELIEQIGARRVGLLGVTFKSGTDDLRESPQIDLIGRILSAGQAEVRVFDRNVTARGLALATAHSTASTPATREALRLLPSLLAEDPDDLIEWADVIVVAHGTTDHADIVRGADKPKRVLDLVRLPADLRAQPGYHGVCW